MLKKIRGYFANVGNPTFSQTGNSEDWDGASNYIKSIKKDLPPPVSPEDGRNTINLLECIEKSLDEQRPVPMNQEKSAKIQRVATICSQSLGAISHEIKRIAPKKG